jgi:hypothetical protein
MLTNNNKVTGEGTVLRKINWAGQVADVLDETADKFLIRFTNASGTCEMWIGKCAILHKVPCDEKLFTPEKVRKDAELRKCPEFKFIASNRRDYATWHIGRRKESRGARSGLISSVYYVTACSGQQLGGAWGQMTLNYEEPYPEDLCKRCVDWKWKNELRRGQKITV